MYNRAKKVKKIKKYKSKNLELWLSTVIFKLLKAIAILLGVLKFALLKLFCLYEYVVKTQEY